MRGVGGATSGTKHCQEGAMRHLLGLLLLGWLGLLGFAPAVSPELRAFEVGINVNDVEMAVAVPAGADADVVAKNFGAKHGLSADGASVVARRILSRGAELSGKWL
eukprot:COSAG01_NODE_30685_length_611_cov_1.158203_1_plen_105_part_10